VPTVITRVCCTGEGVIEAYQSEYYPPPPPTPKAGPRYDNVSGEMDDLIFSARTRKYSGPDSTQEPRQIDDTVSHPGAIAAAGLASCAI